MPLNSRGSALATQAWVPRGKAKPPAAEYFRPVCVRDYPHAKPLTGGGFWTSTYDERYGSGWVQWCLSEGFGCEREDPTFPIWTLEPSPDARVYTIDTYADLEHLCRLYGRTRTYDCGHRAAHHDTFPDWSLVAEAYDAVHLTDDGQWATRLSMPLNLYGWDCESTLWLRWAFATATDLGRVRVAEGDPWAEEAIAS